MMRQGSIGFGNVNGTPAKYDHVKSKLHQPTASVSGKYVTRNQQDSFVEKEGSLNRNASNSKIQKMKRRKGPEKASLGMVSISAKLSCDQTNESINSSMMRSIKKESPNKKGSPYRNSSMIGPSNEAERLSQNISPIRGSLNHSFSSWKLSYSHNITGGESMKNGFVPYKLVVPDDFSTPNIVSHK